MAANRYDGGVGTIDLRHARNHFAACLRRDRNIFLVETTIRLGEKRTRTDMVESYIDEPNT
jgi:hypothetical protein